MHNDNRFFALETSTVGLTGANLQEFDLEIGFITENYRSKLEHAFPLLRELNLVDQATKAYEAIKPQSTYLAMVDGCLSVIAEHLIPMDAEDYDSWEDHWKERIYDLVDFVADKLSDRAVKVVVPPRGYTSDSSFGIWVIIQARDCSKALMDTVYGAIEEAKSF